MAAALLRSSMGHALHRAAAAPASSSSRLSSAGGANTRAVRTFYGDDFHSYDARRYTKDVSPAASAEADKFDGYFSFAAFAGVFVFLALIDGDYHYWFRHQSANTGPPPRMTPRRGRW